MQNDRLWWFTCTSCRACGHGEERVLWKCMKVPGRLTWLDWTGSWGKCFPWSMRFLPTAARLWNREPLKLFHGSSWIYWIYYLDTWYSWLEDGVVVWVISWAPSFGPDELGALWMFTCMLPVESRLYWPSFWSQVSCVAPRDPWCKQIGMVSSFGIAIFQLKTIGLRPESAWLTVCRTPCWLADN